MDPRDIWIKERKRLEAQGKWEDSVTFLDKIRSLGQGKKKRDYYYVKGCEHAQIENFQTAIEFFEKDLQFNGKTFETYYQIGQALFNLNNYEKAYEYFNKAWETKFAQLLKFKTQAKTLKNINQYERSLLYYDKAKIIENNFPIKFWYHRGNCLFNLRKYNEANEDYDEYLKNEKNNIEIILKKAKCEFLLENRVSGKNLLNNAIKMNNKFKKIIKQEKMFKNFSFDDN